VHQLEIKVLDIADARCNHEVYSRWYLAAMSVHSIFTAWTHHVNFYRP